MHRLMRVVVKAKDEKEALKKAKACLNRRMQHDWDYYALFGTKDDNSPVSGSARWGKMRTVYQLWGSVGGLLVDSGFRAQKKEIDTFVILSNGKTIKDNKELAEIVGKGNWNKYYVVCADVHY